MLQSDGSYAHYTTKTPPYLIGCHHAAFDSALQIEPSPLTGREQGLESPLGGQVGEPVTTQITDFSNDGDGQYTLTFDAVDGSDQTSAMIYSNLSTSDTESCWSFEFRVDADVAGEVQTACRENSGASDVIGSVQFEHDHVH